LVRWSFAEDATVAPPPRDDRLRAGVGMVDLSISKYDWFEQTNDRTPKKR
jgi:hypothetical protein